MAYHLYVVDNIDISRVIENLRCEFDALIEERQRIRIETAALNKRAGEIDRKLQGIQQTLQGFSLYTNAQEVPTELTRKVQRTISETLQGLRNAMDLSEIAITVGEVPKTLTECCRDILRRNSGWVSAVQVRDALLAAGFDFSSYTSNPLTSIHTTLKRLSAEELETRIKDGGTFYRWKAKESANPSGAA